MERTPENRLAAPAIRASGLSKCYHLYDRPLLRLLQLFRGHRRRYYREFWALRDASFEVGRGEVLGIVGRNGAGKSTLLQLVCGTLTPTSGTIQVSGRVAALLELGAGFNPDFTGRENVLLAASILGLSKAEIDERLEGIIDFSGIRDFIDQPVKFYSSGMYVRLAFSVATSVNPDILVIDEALSVGDGEFARKSFDRILELKKAGVTILFCSHALYQVEAFCDRVLWLEHGSVVLLGKPQDVIQKYTASLATSKATPEAATTAREATQLPNAAASARFTRIEIAVDGRVARELRARSGESTLTVRLQFESDPSLPPPVIGVTIDYGTLLAVTCAVTRSDGVTIARDSAGRGEATLTFPQLALRKGEYRIGAYLGCENALHLYDGIQQCATLLIDDVLPEPGLVNLSHIWRSSGGHGESFAAFPPAPANTKNENSTVSRIRSDSRRETLRDGRTLWIDSRDSLGLAAQGVFEPDETALCEALIQPGNRVLDIGANIGYYTTLFARRVGATGRVDAIEPDPDNFALLDANTKEWQQLGNVRLHAIALSAKSGHARLYRSKDNVGMHRLYDSVCCDGTAIDVPARRGDELTLAPLDFIKIDVEGFEAAVLEGLSSTLARSPNVKILCEYSPLAMLEAGADPRHWLDWIRTQGFHPLAFDGARWTRAACADLDAQAARLASFDLTALTSTLGQADNVSINAAAATAARAHGYTRPILENLLFVRDTDVSILVPPHERSPANVEPASERDEPDLLALFARAFGHGVSSAQWRWKYANAQPEGTVVRRGERVVAFYGGMPRTIRLHGEPVTAVQIGDVMVDPSERGAPRRRSPFFLAASRFAEDMIGPGRPYAFAFGFPSERHARLGERLGLYARVDEILDANWRPLPATPGVLHRTRPLADDELGRVDELWAEMADDLRDTAIGTRDSSYVRHRYLRHPTVRYLLFFVKHRFSRQPIGLLVLRDHGESGVELVDTIAPVKSLATLVSVAQRFAGRLRRRRVFAWMTPRAAESFKASAPALKSAGIPIPTIVWKAVPDLDKLRGRWWLLGGDADSR